MAQIELQQALTSSALSSTHSITYVSSVKFVHAGKNYNVDKGGKRERGRQETGGRGLVEHGVKEQLQLQLLSLPLSTQTCEKSWKNC